MTNDAELIYLFICHLCIFFGEVFIRIFAYFKITFFLLSCKRFLYILDTSFLPDRGVTIISSHSVGCFVHCLNNVLWSTKF